MLYYLRFIFLFLSLAGANSIVFGQCTQGALFPTAINLFNPYATPNKFSVTPEFLVDQVKPSSEVKIVPLIPTPTNFTSSELLTSNVPESVV